MSSKKTFEFPQRLLERYIHAEREWLAMSNYIREHSEDCEERAMNAPKQIIKRYGLSYEWRTIGLAWYLLEQYFKGNITIKKDGNSTDSLSS